MPSTKPKKPSHSTSADTTRAVDQFMESLEHPLKPVIEKLRRLIVEIDPSVSEGIKWNSPSFRTSEYFATTNLRSKSGLGLVLHLGAKVRALPAGTLNIQDPTKLLKWLATDRALVEFKDEAEVEEKALSLQAVLRQWITHV